MKPEYRFVFGITDETRNERVVSGSTYINTIEPDGSCESVELEIFSALRAFRAKYKEQYEKENYQNN